MENLKSLENKTTGEMLTEIFNDIAGAANAINLLESKGYTDDEINVLMSEDIRDKYFKGDFNTIKKKHKVLKGIGAGSALGITFGAIAGSIAVANIIIPGVGLIATGSFAAALAGAGAGGVAGGLIGALAGWGVSEEKTKIYEQAIKEGKIIVGIHPHSEEDAKLFAGEWEKCQKEFVLEKS